MELEPVWVGTVELVRPGAVELGTEELVRPGAVELVWVGGILVVGTDVFVIFGFILGDVGRPEVKTGDGTLVEMFIEVEKDTDEEEDDVLPSVAVVLLIFWELLFPERTRKSSPQNMQKSFILFLFTTISKRSTLKLGVDVPPGHGKVRRKKWTPMRGNYLTVQPSWPVIVHPKLVHELRSASCTALVEPNKVIRCVYVCVCMCCVCCKDLS